MSANSQNPSSLVRFLDSFLQEKNIKWVLLLGTMILLGSSLMLVTTHWDSYTPVWKYLMLLSYTLAVFAGGEWSYRHLGLRRTGTILLALTVLLLPITFLALHWVRTVESNALTGGVYLILLGVNFVLGQLTARHVFRHFLRGDQPTFVVSYLILCLGGAVAPGLPASWAPAGALFLWAIFTLGTVKVNRHVFWMTEEGLAPRIFGFFPIGLLGLQFLGLFAVNFAPHLSLEWMGLACALAAVPVLLTADTVVAVFQQRTGDLVQPLPWSIVLPFGVGLLLCATGICLAGTGIATRQPHALVPTAAVVAGLMAVAARRTRKQAFVWAMLAGIVLAYNFAPVFFQELARAAVRQGAEAVREQRLPYAFYGLTYLPLLLVLMLAATICARTGNEVFARPLRIFCTGLSSLLLIVSISHPKALFPVAAVMTVIFALQTILFRERRPALLAVGAWILAARGFPFFAAHVLELPLPADIHLLCLALAGAVLLFPGRVLDRWISSLPVPAQRDDSLLREISENPCRFASLLLSLTMAAVWTIQHGPILGEPGAWPAAALIAFLLILHSLVWLRTAVSLVAILFVDVVALTGARVWNLSPDIVVSLATLQLLLQWLAGYVLEKFPTTRGARAFSLGNFIFSFYGLFLGLSFLYLPLFALEMEERCIPAALRSLLEPLSGAWWLCRLLIVLWAFDAARRLRSGVPTILGCLGVLGLAGSTFISWAEAPAHQWLPAVWSITALAGLPAMQLLYLKHEQFLKQEDAAEAKRYRALYLPLEFFLWSVFALAALGTLPFFLLSMRLAAGVALAGLLAIAALRQRCVLRSLSLALVNWQILCLAVQWFCPEMKTLANLVHVDFLPACLPVAFLGAVSLFLWQEKENPRSTLLEEIAFLQRCSLRLLCIVLLWLSRSLPGLDAVHVICSAGTFAVLALVEIETAIRRQEETRAWFALALALIAFAYFMDQGVLMFGGAACMFLVLGTGFFLWTLGQWAATQAGREIMAGPFQKTGMILPLAVVAAGVYRHLIFIDPDWLGLNSLALLLSAGFYFWRGLEQRSRPLLILAGVVLNLALAMLWRELAWTDPQFTMIPLGISILALVEILREEFAASLRDPLRYLGALVILVSPTFHIVGGSWLHLFTLMVAAVAVVLTAIGIRVRALVYTGTAFLVADLLAMVVRGSIDNPNVLWLAGLSLGAGVLAFGAACENHRELLLQRMRIVSTTLKSWD